MSPNSQGEEFANTALKVNVLGIIKCLSSETIGSYYGERTSRGLACLNKDGERYMLSSDDVSPLMKFLTGHGIECKRC